MIQWVIRFSKNRETHNVVLVLLLLLVVAVVCVLVFVHNSTRYTRVFKIRYGGANVLCVYVYMLFFVHSPTQQTVWCVCTPSLSNSIRNMTTDTTTPLTTQQQQQYIKCLYTQKQRNVYSAPGYHNNNNIYIHYIVACACACVMFLWMCGLYTCSFRPTFFCTFLHGNREMKRVNEIGVLNESATILTNCKFIRGVCESKTINNNIKLQNSYLSLSSFLFGYKFVFECVCVIIVVVVL